MKKKTQNEQIICNDILRYKKNKLSSSLALLGLVFNCLYFMLLYSFNNRYFYTIEIGISVILTLATLLVIFLSSEGVKGYNKIYSYVLLGVAVVQIVRMIVMPIMAVQGVTWFAEGEFTGVMEGHYFGIELTSEMSCVILVIYLAASAACLVAAAVTGYIYSLRLEKFTKKLESGEISVEATLAEMDSEDEAAASQPSETQQEVQ